MNLDERTDPEPTEVIEIVISVTVNKRADYQKQIASISECVVGQFPELNVQHMNSPLQVRIKIR